MPGMMRLLTALAAPDVNRLVIQCACGKIILHRADRWIVRCECGCQVSTGTLRERYLEEQSTMSEKQRLEHLQITQQLLDRVHRGRQKTVKDVPANGQIPCARELRNGVFFGCGPKAEASYDPLYLGCVMCEWAEVCKSCS